MGRVVAEVVFREPDVREVDGSRSRFVHREPPDRRDRIHAMAASHERRISPGDVRPVGGP